MTIEYYELGTLHSDIDIKHFKHEQSTYLLNACITNADYEVIEIRSLTTIDNFECDIVVVDCGDGTVISKNKLGIKVKERLALLHFPERKLPFEVRTLRKKFPRNTLHQNHVPQHEPCSLCLYFEPWTSVERTWTPESFLNRILWWLRETVKGTLHRDDQALEQAYFESKYRIILPSNFHEESRNQDLALQLSLPYGQTHEVSGSITILGEFKDSDQVQNAVSIPEFLTITIHPILLETILPHPNTLGELEEQLINLGSGIFENLKSVIHEKVSKAKDGIDIPANTNCLIFINIPLLRAVGGKPERIHSLAYIVHDSIATLGIKLNALFKDEIKRNKAYVESNINKSVEEFIIDETIRDIIIEPLSVKLRIDTDFSRRASGIEDYQEFKGIIAGVGALGSSLADIWSKESWGSWSYIDDDKTEPHNVIRHIAKDVDIGIHKVQVVKTLTDFNFEPHLSTSSFINAKINDNNPDIEKILNESDLLIDVTTTIDAPRDLSLLSTTPRMASVFVTPSGKDSVLIFEDKNKRINLLLLEIQYYRAILQNDWGKYHLIGHAGDIWIGGGCREASVIMSYELIQLHAATLARQIRSKYLDDTPSICIWSSSKDGSVDYHNIDVDNAELHECGVWSVTWDQGLTDIISKLRTKDLPNETGGILLGYFDQKTKIVNVVDIVPAPADSKATPSSFIRGIEGLDKIQSDSASRTAGIVQYIGEWHSHPKNASTEKSSVDMTQMKLLIDVMSNDGQPGLMIIVGDKEINININSDSIKSK